MQLHLTAWNPDLYKYWSSGPSTPCWVPNIDIPACRFITCSVPELILVVGTRGGQKTRCSILQQSTIAALTTT